MCKWVAASALLLGSYYPLRGADLVLEYPAQQRIIAKQLFTQDGTTYVRGTKSEKCNYAYLENPRISPLESRLRIEAQFSGRTAANFFGRCLGLGDDFPVVITAEPYYHDGMIGFREVRVESPGRDGMYIRGVLQAMTRSLSTEFQYQVQEDARRTLEEKRDGAAYAQQLRDFTVTRIHGGRRLIGGT